MTTIELKPLAQKFLNEVTLKVNPKFNIRKKSEPKTLYSFVSKIIRIFNKEVDERYITVLFGTMWIPDSFLEKDEKEQLVILAHETTHEFDRKRLSSFVFGGGYLFPQVLSLLSVLSILSIWYGSTWLFSLLFLLLLAPLPAPVRMWIELRGYRTNFLFDRFVDKTDPETLGFYLDYYVSQFTSSAYYWMWPFKEHLKGLLSDESKILNDSWYKQILSWLKENNLTS